MAITSTRFKGEMLWSVVLIVADQVFTLKTCAGRVMPGYYRMAAQNVSRCVKLLSVRRAVKRENIKRKACALIVMLDCLNAARQSTGNGIKTNLVRFAELCRQWRKGCVVRVISVNGIAGLRTMPKKASRPVWLKAVPDWLHLSGIAVNTGNVLNQQGTLTKPNGRTSGASIYHTHCMRRGIACGSVV